MEKNNGLIQGVQSEVQHEFSNLFTEFTVRLSQKWHALPPEKRVYFTQLGLLVATQASDTLTTAIGLQTIPGAKEDLAVSSFILDKGGMALLGLVKMVAPVGLIAMMEIIRNRGMGGKTSPIINNAMRFVNSVYTAASVNNAAYLLIK